MKTTTKSRNVINAVTEPDVPATDSVVNGEKIVEKPKTAMDIVRAYQTGITAKYGAPYKLSPEQARDVLADIDTSRENPAFQAAMAKLPLWAQKQILGARKAYELRANTVVPAQTAQNLVTTTKSYTQIKVEYAAKLHGKYGKPEDLNQQEAAAVVRDMIASSQTPEFRQSLGKLALNFQRMLLLARKECMHDYVKRSQDEVIF